MLQVAVADLHVHERDKIFNFLLFLWAKGDPRNFEVLIARLLKDKLDPSIVSVKSRAA